MTPLSERSRPGLIGMAAAIAAVFAAALVLASVAIFQPDVFQRDDVRWTICDIGLELLEPGHGLPTRGQQLCALVR